MRVTEGFHDDRNLQTRSPDPTHQTTLNFPFIQLPLLFPHSSEAPAKVPNLYEKMLERVVLTCFKVKPLPSILCKAKIIYYLKSKILLLLNTL